MTRKRRASTIASLAIAVALVFTLVAPVASADSQGRGWVIIPSDKASAGNDGWFYHVETDTKQWISADCRADLETRNVDVEIRPYSDISTIDDNAHFGCGQLVPVPSDAPPDPLPVEQFTTFIVLFGPAASWVVADGQAYWTSDADRDCLLGKGMPEEDMDWFALDALRSEGAPSFTCDQYQPGVESNEPNPIAPDSNDDEYANNYDSAIEALIDLSYGSIAQHFLEARTDADCDHSRSRRVENTTVVVTGAPVNSAGSPLLWPCISVAEDGKAVVTLKNNRSYVARVTLTDGLQIQDTTLSDSSWTANTYSAADSWFASLSVLDSEPDPDSVLLKPGAKVHLNVTREATVTVDNTKLPTATLFIFGFIDAFLTSENEPRTAFYDAIQSGTLHGRLSDDCLVDAAALDDVTLTNCIQELSKDKFEDVIGTLGRKKIEESLLPKMTRFSRVGGKIVSKILSKLPSAAYQVHDLSRSHWEDGDVTITVLDDGDIARTSQGRSALVWDGRLHEIESTEVWACLTDEGRSVRKVHDDAFKALEIGEPARCFNPLIDRGKILTTPDNKSWYYDQTGWLHHIESTNAFHCHGGESNRLWIAENDLDGLDVGEPAECLELKHGDVAVHDDGDSYLIVNENGRLVRRDIESVPIFACLEAQGHNIVRDVPRYKFSELELVGAAVAVCVPQVENMIIRSADLPHWTALVRGGKKYNITSGGVYNCLSTWEGVAEYHEPLASDQIRSLPYAGNASCDAHIEQARGLIVKATDGGHSIYVDAGGIAHNIETTNSYSCLVDDEVAVLEVPDHSWQQAFSFGEDQPGCRKLLRSSDGNSYVEEASGQLLRIPDTQTYYCVADQLPSRRVASVDTSVIEDLGVDGEAKRCFSPSRYEGKIVRDSGGRAGIVLSGNWRSIRDGHSWACYRSRGYEIGEYSLHPDHIDAAGLGTRMPDCLDPDSFRNTLIRRSDGTVFRTNSSSCRYHVGNGWTHEALIESGLSVTTNHLNTEHTNSLPNCGTHEWLFSKKSFKNSLIRRARDGAVYYVDGAGCRHHVRDHYTLERLDEQGIHRKHWSAADSEINSLPSCASHSLMLAQHRVENHVVRGPDGTSWFVRGGEWFWIDSGSKWNYLVSRYGLAPGTYDYSWEHIDSIKWDRGNWAGWW